MKIFQELQISWPIARREIRNGVFGFRILIACLVLGVATITIIGSIKSGQNDRKWEATVAEGSKLTLDEYYDNNGKNIPLGRVGEAIEAGDLICFLASEKASYISGTAINIDGGAAPVV